MPILDRLARSVPDARAIGDSLAARSIRLQLGTMIDDPTDPMGKRPAESARRRRAHHRPAGGAVRDVAPDGVPSPRPRRHHGSHNGCDMTAATTYSTQACTLPWEASTTPCRSPLTEPPSPTPPG
ncbi:hypothetical protein [Nocardia sp. NPDC019304]|uniref:hypothetical protein n=1 Tax=unclassified Nocardia TaxID=2637762 RepID=UPI0033C32D6C